MQDWEDWSFYVPVNNFSVMSDGSSWVEPVLSKDKFVLLKDTTQWHWWGSNPQPLGHESSAQPLSNCAPSRLARKNRLHVNSFVCLFDLILYVPSAIFQLNRDGSSWVEPVLSWDKCVLLKDHNAVTPVMLESPAPWSRVKYSTTAWATAPPTLLFECEDTYRNIDTDRQAFNRQRGRQVDI